MSMSKPWRDQSSEALWPETRRGGIFKAQYTRTDAIEPIQMPHRATGRFTRHFNAALWSSPNPETWAIAAFSVARVSTNALLPSARACRRSKVLELASRLWLHCAAFCHACQEDAVRRAIRGAAISNIYSLLWGL